MPTQNFAFLAEHDPVFVQIAEAAERNLAVDPNTTLVKLRQLGEAFAKHAAATFGLWTGPQTTQLEMLRAMEAKGYIEREVAQLFHALRIAGNDATHDFVGSRTQALDHLKLARKLAIWFHRTFGGPAARDAFKPGPFVPPEDHTARIRALEDELAQARLQLEAHKKSATAAAQVAEIEAKRRAEAEALAKTAEEERAVYAELAVEAEQKLNASVAQFNTSLAKLQSDAAAKSAEALQVVKTQAIKAGSHVELDEAETRLIIDGQLRAAGWDADSVKSRFSLGARPEHGKNKAIAEWPTGTGPADYVLFRGLTPLGVVEAKRKAKNVYSCIEQAKRYSWGFKTAATETKLPCSPGWDSGQPEPYKVPFLFSTNGRPYHRQFEQESGIWFLDARRPANHPRPLVDWYTPDGLQGELEKDVQAAHALLKTEPTDYLRLYYFQVRAVRAVEKALQAGQRECLLAMATGTGKTRTAIGLIYRLLKSKRCRRVLFLVDRTTLGQQAQDKFEEMRLEQDRAFSDIYSVKELGDLKPEASTMVHIATVQSMVKRVFLAEEGERLPIDAYDCIIVDESHRGYTLDKEMGEGEQWMRSFHDYVSTYRRVLDYFDAVKVGLTATPALHTREIFGDPVFIYSYREAVADGYLIDHEPPVRLRTKLAEAGITFEKGSDVEVIHADGQLDLWKTPDELTFEIDAFNRTVVTEGFNRVVCQVLADHLDPESDEKTLIFCANDNHADLVVRLLKETLDAKYGSVSDDAVMKITGAADKPDARLRRYKNERFPNIAVTVDLLTTGIDVPRICNLVFLRRVRSRILYEQMMGRATRLCDEIGKEVFRIYDAVDLYAALEEVTDMKPVVKDVHIPIGQFIQELVSPQSATVQGSEGKSHADDVLTQIVERLRRRIRRAGGSKATPSAEYLATVEPIETLFGQPISKLPEVLKMMGTAGLGQFLSDRPHAVALLEQFLSAGIGYAGRVISHHGDQFIAAEHALPHNQGPADYLESFKKFVAENMNKLPALAVVVQKPRELTRKQLKELRLALDAAEYGERQLEAAWHDMTNQDIAAGIIGFIRKQALGSPLLPYTERVDRAVTKLLSSQPWTPPQKKWLELIAKQLKQEKVVDREAMDDDPFKAKGGFKHVDKAFDGKLSAVLTDLHDAIWNDVA